jgi:hypothetical protein
MNLIECTEKAIRNVRRGEMVRGNTILLWRVGDKKNATEATRIAIKHQHWLTRERAVAAAMEFDPRLAAELSLEAMPSENDPDCMKTYIRACLAVGITRKEIASKSDLANDVIYRAF